jgi:transglutaminase-like putative cysteine protease
MNPPKPAPRLLIGSALLLWGAVTANPLAGLLLAVAAEGHGWTRVRWDFSETAILRAWRLSMLILIVVAALVWMDGAAFYAAPRTMVWLPLISFPLLFVQNYGLAQGMPLTAFSHLLKRRRSHAEKHGLPFREMYFHFAPVYFVLIILASSLGKHSDHWVFFPGAVLLTAWLLKDRFAKKPRIAPLAATVVIVLATIGGYSGAVALEAAYHYIASGRGGGQDRSDWARHSHTSIGELGELKQSPRIVWRVIPRQGELPALLRVASYNLYRSTFWTAVLPPDARTSSEDFDELNTFELGGTIHHVTARSGERDFIDGATASAPDLSRFTIRGAVARRDLLPISGNAGSVAMAADKMELNSYGTLRMEPGQSVIDATILWHPDFVTGRPPLPTPEEDGALSADLRLPTSRHASEECEAVRRMVDRLGLREVPLAEKIRRLKNEFTKNFTYSRYASQALPPPSGGDFIRQFLEETRRGHCEYFATSTVFLLRECGIPTRYATGFAVHERDKNGIALLRGIHAHAWAIAWDEDQGRWIDVDLTPPDWTGMETPRLPPWQHLLDRWQGWVDDFSVWRSNPGNLGMLAAIVATPLVIGGVFIFRRLWKSRKRIDPGRSMRFATVPSPLDGLERVAARVLGPRPRWQPFARWLGPLAERLADPAMLERALRLHQQLRFDPAAPREELAGELERLGRELRKEIRRLS